MTASPAHPVSARPARMSDDPIRMPSAARRNDVRIDAGRQLRLGLWMVLVIAIGFGATLAATPRSIDTAERADAASTLSSSTSAPVSGARLALAEIR